MGASNEPFGDLSSACLSFDSMLSFCCAKEREAKESAADARDMAGKSFDTCRHK